MGGKKGKRPTLFSISPLYTLTWYNSKSLLIAFGSPFLARLSSRLRWFSSSSSVWEPARRCIFKPFSLRVITTMDGLEADRGYYIHEPVILPGEISLATQNTLKNPVIPTQTRMSLHLVSY